MIDLRDLYQEVIIDHNRSPRNFHEMAQATNQAEGYNPLCGDKLNLFLKINDDKIMDASFIGVGCAISTASASLMTEALIGKTLEEAKDTFAKFHSMLTTACDSQFDLGKLEIFAGVKAYPTRVKCATLAWHTLQAALNNRQDVVSTE